MSVVLSIWKSLLTCDTLQLWQEGKPKQLVEKREPPFGESEEISASGKFFFLSTYIWFKQITLQCFLMSVSSFYGQRETDRERKTEDIMGFSHTSAILLRLLKSVHIKMKKEPEKITDRWRQTVIRLNSWCLWNWHEQAIWTKDIDRGAQTQTASKTLYPAPHLSTEYYIKEEKKQTASPIDRPLTPTPTKFWNTSAAYPHGSNKPSSSSPLAIATESNLLAFIHHQSQK